MGRRTRGLRSSDERVLRPRRERRSSVAVLSSSLEAADAALHNGDASARAALWSHDDPVTLFGAAVTTIGWEKVGATFDWLASRFSNCTAFAYEVLAAGVSGDLAYIVGVEHTTASIGDDPPAAYALRVTTILRREAGEWRIVHRHGDPFDDSSADVASRLHGEGPAMIVG